ncbi:serine protease [Asticcacaulis sp. SL142]|uniref:S1C family serine protease n=1 Tax=Asticcacaulis sp. SL142 TaxID=2995155 RepID=UPI00226C695E|nr:serine protease [Asticcacaulis sp. SL142]WAC47473.1 serine protease [Asticcacaulis sp. SL142]
MRLWAHKPLAASNIRGLSAGALLCALWLSLMALPAVATPAVTEAPASASTDQVLAEMVDPKFQPINSTKALKSSEQSVVRVLVVYRGFGGVPLDAVGMGSGFVVAPGYIVTNFHVVEAPPEASSAEIYIVPHKDTGAGYQQVELVKSWTEGDLALLKAPSLKVAPLKLYLTPQKNQRIIAMGYPGVTDRLLKRGGTELLVPADAYVTQGSIALFASTNPDGGRVDTLFHTAPVNPGNSGGPLLDECGQVVGVNTWSAASSLSDSGDFDVPAGQYVATHVSALNTFLSSAGITPQIQGEACYAKSEDEISKDDALTKALAAAAEAQRQRLEQAKKAEAASALMDQLQLAALVVLSVLVLVLIVVHIRREREHKEKAAPTAYAPEPDTTPETADARPLHLKTTPAKVRIKHPFPWGWTLLGVLVVILAMVFVVRDSGLWERHAAKKAAAETAPEGLVRLACEVDKSASPRPLSGAGPTEFEFEASRACVNNRTPYERQADGSLLRFTVSDSEPFAAKLELSKDGLRFKRSDYRLSAEAHQAYVSQRTALGTLRCASPDNAGQQAALKDNLQKVRTLAQSYLTAAPETQTVWRCHKTEAVKAIK